MTILDTLESIAPTIAAALGGPLAGAAVEAIGGILGVPQPTQDAINKVVQSSQLTAEQVGKLKELELQYQQQEKELGFKYTELAFKDRDSARQANVAGGISRELFFLSLLILAGCFLAESYVLFNGYPKNVPDVVAGRILGFLDAAAMLVLSYYYGSSMGAQPTQSTFTPPQSKA